MGIVVERHYNSISTMVEFYQNVMHLPSLNLCVCISQFIKIKKNVSLLTKQYDWFSYS
jgi:hypothetical protein